MTPVFYSTTNDDKKDTQNPFHVINVAITHIKTTHGDKITVTIERHTVRTKASNPKDLTTIIKVRLSEQIHTATSVKKIKNGLQNKA